MQDLIYSFGLERNKDIEITKNRLYFNLGNVSQEKIIENAMEQVQSKLKIDLNNFRPEVIQRDNKEGYYLNWHIDDCAIYKHDTTENKTNNIPLNDKYSLYHKSDLPKFTMIIYLTSIDEDFKGGEFEFVDLLIRPKKYDVVFFDSREVHRVRRFREGERKNIFVKFYEK
jgi:hypothetical protein